MKRQRLANYGQPAELEDPPFRGNTPAAAAVRADHSTSTFSKLGPGKLDDVAPWRLEKVQRFLVDELWAWD